MTEPGLIRFDVQTGEATIYHWSRTLSPSGGTPAGEWVAAQKDKDGGLLLHLSSGEAFSYTGHLLWHGAEGALFAVTEGSRQRLLLTDSNFKVQTERWLPDEYRSSFDWRREESGWFHFWTRESNTRSDWRISMLTGALEPAGPAAKSGLWVEQSSLFAPSCASDGGGNLVRIGQGERLLWTVIDAVAPVNHAFAGTRILAGGAGALLQTVDGPSILRLPGGTLQVAPELKALGSSRLYASPLDPDLVASDPFYESAADHYTIRLQRLGQSAPAFLFQIQAERGPGTDVRLASSAYWSPDGRYLQVAVSFPDAGGKCSFGDDESTLLDPVVLQGDYQGSLSVRAKLPTRLYAAQKEGEDWVQGAEIGPVLAGETFKVKGVVLTPSKLLLVERPGVGEGLIPVSRSALEWVKP